MTNVTLMVAHCALGAHSWLEFLLHHGAIVLCVVYLQFCHKQSLVDVVDVFIL